MPFLDLSEQPLPVLFLILATAGAIVWYAGTRIARYVDTIATRTHIGQAFAGMLLLGGVTSLPEVATAGTAAAGGNALLTVNNLLGAASINLLILAVGDFIYGKDALTSVAGRPVTIIQGVLGMILLAGVGLAIALTDVEIPLLGAGVATVILAAACVQALRISQRFERTKIWQLVDPPLADAEEPARELECGSARLALLTAAAAFAILVGGVLLATTGDVLAVKTGLGSSIVGFTLLGLCTTLPELSTVLAALKMRRYQLAIGDIFGTNLFNIQILFVADLFYREGALLDAAGTFELAATCLAVLLTGIFVVGLLERRNRRFGRIGTDSALVLILYAGGLVALSGI